MFVISHAMACFLSLPYVFLCTCINEVTQQQLKSWTNLCEKLTRILGKIYFCTKKDPSCESWENFLCFFMRDEFIMTFNICATEWDFSLYYVGKFTEWLSNHSRIPQKSPSSSRTHIEAFESSLLIHHIFKFRHDNAHSSTIVSMWTWKL